MEKDNVLVTYTVTAQRCLLHTSNFFRSSSTFIFGISILYFDFYFYNATILFLLNSHMMLLVVWTVWLTASESQQKEEQQSSLWSSCSSASAPFREIVPGQSLHFALSTRSQCSQALLVEYVFPTLERANASIFCFLNILVNFGQRT